MTRTWTYEAGTKRLLTETHPESGQVEHLEYWPTGALKKTRDAKQTLFEYAFDGAGRLEEVTTTAGGVVERTRLDYEAGSDRVALTRWPNMTTPQVTTALTYDAAGRLAARVDTVDGEAFEVLYAYDTRDHLIGTAYPSGVQR